MTASFAARIRTSPSTRLVSSRCLLAHAGRDAKKIALGEELLRFAEDQFVVWERPPADLKVREDNLKPELWFTPCSLEQYAMFEPISGSSAWMMMTYLRAYDATGKAIYLAKAESLANALTAAQRHHHGRYPTRMVRRDLAYWINSTVNTIRAMNMLAAKTARAAPQHGSSHNGQSMAFFEAWIGVGSVVLAE